MTFFKLYGKVIKRDVYIEKGGIMSIKATSKKPLFGNRRSHALNATRHMQKLNMQNVTLLDGTKVKMTTREAKKYKKDMKEKEDKVSL